MPFELIALPYADDALAPTISAETLSFHHGKHHKAYVDKTNAAIAGTALADADLEKVISETRGKDKGLWRIDEVRSPVIFWERCLTNDDGELVSGQLWAELDVTQQTGRRDAAPERFRARFMEIDVWIRKTFRKTHPKGFWVGPQLTRTIKQTGLKLRENHHFGREITVHGT